MQEIYFLERTFKIYFHVQLQYSSFCLTESDVLMLK